MSRPNHDNAKPASASYLAYVFVGGFGLVAGYVYLGYYGVNPFLSVLGGAAIHSLFQASRHRWGTNLADAANDPNTTQVSKQGAASLAVTYLTLCLVVVLWYGLGYGMRDILG